MSASPSVFCFLCFGAASEVFRLVRGSTSESVEALGPAPVLSMGAGPGGLRTDVIFALPKGLFKSRGGGGEHVPTCLKYHLLASPTLYILCSKLLYYQPVHLYNENERIPIWALFLSDLPRTFPGSLPCLMLQVPAVWYGSYVPCKNRFFGVFFF